MNNAMDDNNRERIAAPHLDDRMARLNDMLGESARRARDSVLEHPYFTAGILVGLGAAITGVIAFSRRRRTFFERIFGG